MSVKYILQRTLLLVSASVFAFILAETLLRIVNPIEIRIRGDKIELPRNQLYKIKNKSINNIDSVITVTKNHLGFRGPKAPVNFDDCFSIITVGGSTTECFYLSDGKTWTDVLMRDLSDSYGIDNVWANNAGLDGNTTYGHYVLMDDYIVRIKPKMVLFLIGLNDIGKKHEDRYDQKYRKSFFKTNIFKKLLNSMCYYSDVFALSKTFYKYLSATKDLGHYPVDLKELELLTISPQEMERVLAKHKNNYLLDYEKSLLMLIEISRANGIEPVFITQPALFGACMDPVTNLDLGKVKTFENENGELSWKILELYNDVTRRVGNESDVCVIELARELPKNSDYYYDMYHFNNIGADKVGKIISRQLHAHLISK